MRLKQWGGPADKTGEVEQSEERQSEVLEEIALQRNLLALSAALGAASAAPPEDRTALVAAELRQLAEQAKGNQPRQQAGTGGS